MKLYGKRRAIKSVENRIRLHRPDRDAIIWALDVDNHFAQVRIQGSDTLIKAHFPKNWTDQPYWLQLGSCVRIRHRGGNTGYIEIIGEGRAIPSAQAGGSTPGIGTLADAILTGLVVTPGTPQGMYVAVSSGTYRINGGIYVFTAEPITAPLMADPPPMIMYASSTITMGQGEYRVSINAAPAAGKSRYDLISIGVDGTLDYQAGAVANLATEPTIPSLAADHLTVKVLWITETVTEVDNSVLGGSWQAPGATSFDYTCSCASCEMPWNGGDDFTECTMNLVIRDQHGDASTDLDGEIMTITMATAPGHTGDIKGNLTGYAGAVDDPSAQSQITGSTVWFTYKRDQTATPEIAPVFGHSITNGAPLLCSNSDGLFKMVLLDNVGDPIGG
ncbi:hypothetical protein LCGC14_1068690 [marine sediment metagenome]|uniref:Uncharacterized protein n=1 Tax=marine sediment metagenome TaxID=412755 RepID=A0A0F9MNU6_9ZZZZ